MPRESSKESHISDDLHGRDTVGSVSALASQALGVLAQRRSGQKAQLSERHLGALIQAVSGPDPRERDRVVHSMLGAGIGRDEICDLYVPEIARRMGRDWCEDTMSFADVTIGSARLQALLRDIDKGRDLPVQASRGSVAVMVVADEYHTLGAMVLTGQLRRMGVSVRLVLGRPMAEVRMLVRDYTFDAILISAALRDDLDAVRETVTSLRTETKGAVPLIVGGGIVELGADTAKDLTGADHVTNDVHLALELGGIAERLSGDA